MQHDADRVLAHGVLADRVDAEPPAILGLTTSELLMLSLVVGLVCLPSIIIVAALLGLIDVVLPLTGFAFLGGMALGAVIFRRLKRGRPHGYYQVRFAIWRERIAGGNRFILRSGPWSVGRGNRASRRGGAS